MVVYHFQLEVALVIAFLAFRMANGDAKTIVRKFRLRVVNGLGEQHQRSANTGRLCVLRYSSRDNRRKSNVHQNFLGRQPIAAYHPDCSVCSRRIGNKRKQTSLICKQCKLPIVHHLF